MTAMGSFACQACGVEVLYTGPGRPRFCPDCAPRRPDRAAPPCEHGVSARGRCEPCEWARDFHRRIQPPRMTGGRRHLTDRQRRAEAERQIEEMRAARRTEVAAVRALELGDEERDERLVIVRGWVSTAIADLKAELRDR